MIISPSNAELEYNPISSEIYHGLKEIEDNENNGARYGYAYYLDNCGDGKWYCDHCYQRHECGKRIR